MSSTQEKAPCPESGSDISGVVPKKHHAGKHKLTQNTKESLSAYFTILAAAFGLISDGCECTFQDPVI